MPSDYIPSDDHNFLAWAQAFSGGISADPLRYMLTSGIATAIAATVTTFQDALAVTDSKATRTEPAVAAKDIARFGCESLCRQYAIIIKDNAGIAPEDKIAIGVRPPNSHREPIDAPNTSPLINVLGNGPGQQTLRYADATTPDSRAKPFGYANLQLFLGVGTEESMPLSQCQFYGAFTRNPIDVDFDETQDGQVATYYARWANQKGEVGPWSVPISFRIAA